jgi:hypothetical protein
MGEWHRALSHVSCPSRHTICTAVMCDQPLVKPAHGECQARMLDYGAWRGYAYRSPSSFASVHRAFDVVPDRELGPLDKWGGERVATVRLVRFILPSPAVGVKLTSADTARRTPTGDVADLPADR